MWWLSTILVLTHGLGLSAQTDVERPNFMNALWRQPIGAFRLPLWQKFCQQSSPITSSPGLEGLEAWNPSFMPSYSSNTRTYYSSSRGISRGSSIGIPSSFLNPPRSSMFIPPYSLISRTYYSATPSISREPSPIGRPGSLMNPPRSSSSYGEYNAPQKPIDKYTLNLFGSPSIQSEPSRASYNLGLGAQSTTSSVPNVPFRTRSSNDAPQNPSIGKYTSKMFDAPQPAPSIQSEPSRASFNLGLGAQSATPSVTKVPSRTRSSGGQSSTFSGTDTNSLADNNNMFNAPQNHYIGKSTPNKFESCKNIGVKPRPEIKYGADGRRLAGKQNEKWPVKGGKYNITFSSNLGPTFQGILIPQKTIDLLEQRFRNYTRDSTKDVDNLELGNVQTKKADFQIGFPPEWEQQIDIALINQAIRQAQGDYDDWDKPDPWTYASIYSKDVLELNKKLHDCYREKHYAPPLEYMDAIHSVAHAHATKLARDIALWGDAYLKHNTELAKKNWGENLYSTESDFDGRPPATVVRKGIESWHIENLRYEYYGHKNANILDPITGHFTALVWRSTRRMGLGLAKYRNNAKNLTTYVIVVNYDNGNIDDYYDTNVIKEGAYDDNMDALPKPVNPFDTNVKKATHENNDHEYNDNYNPLEGGLFGLFGDS